MQYLIEEPRQVNPDIQKILSNDVFKKGDFFIET
jgi:hypothetical protein